MADDLNLAMRIRADVAQAAKAFKSVDRSLERLAADGVGEPFEAALHVAHPRDFDRDAGHGLNYSYMVRGVAPSLP